MKLSENRGYLFPKITLNPDPSNAPLMHRPLISKLDEEVEEVKVSTDVYEASRMFVPLNERCAPCVERMNALMEVVDVIHVCETILRFYGVDEEEYGDLITAVQLKNQMRGYYERTS